MLRFDNPGHREHLQSLGILAAGQIEIAPDVLVERLLMSSEMEAGLYILRQEIRTKLANYGLLESQIEMTKAIVTAVSDPISLKSAIERFLVLNSTIAEALQTAEGLDEVVSIFTIRLTSGSYPQWATPEMTDHILNIGKFVKQLRGLIVSQRPAINEQIAEIDRQVQIKREEYEV